MKINTAHMLSLVRSGEVKEDIGRECLMFLLELSPEAALIGDAEDVHQAVEQLAVDRLGVAKAGFLNLGKSRNDQVAAALRMEVRDRIISLLKAVTALQASVLGVVKERGRTVIPGFTHLQHAQPVTLAHHFMAYFDAFQRDFDRLFQLYARVNLSPMGAAALAGTSVRLDRNSVASLLGFSGVIENAMDAVSSRDFAIEALSSAEMVMLDLSRIAEELILWSSKEFNFVEVSDEYAASSSIMPQKKNPVTAEIVRAKCGSVLGSLQSACAIIKALPYSYNLDFQELTPHLWEGLDDTLSSVEIMQATIATLKFNLESIKDSMRDDYSTATSLANHLVKSGGLSFREAHALVGELVRRSLDEGIPFARAARNLPELSKGKAKVDEKKLQQILSATDSLKAIVTPGGANPGFIRAAVAKRQRLVRTNSSRSSNLEIGLRSSEAMLLKSVNSLVRGARGW